MKHPVAKSWTEDSFFASVHNSNVQQLIPQLILIMILSEGLKKKKIWQ